MISYCIIFETNNYVYRNGCKSDTRQGKDQMVINFQGKKIWNNNVSLKQYVEPSSRYNKPE